MHYITVLANWLYGYDKYSNRYSKQLLSESTYPDVFYLLKDDEMAIGLKKAISLSSRTGSQIIRIVTQPDIAVEKNTRNGLGWLIKRNWISVDDVYLYENDEWIQATVEDLTARAYLLDEQNSWESVIPRTISYLPVALACQANCKFCFSEYSISSEKRIKSTDEKNLHAWLQFAKDSGAERFVLTGGGEPGLLKPSELESIFSISSQYFKKNVMITNGLFLHKHSEVLEKLYQAGLSILALSVHHFDKYKNRNIMGIDTRFKESIEIINSSAVNGRLICVLQKEGISDINQIKEYLDFARENNISEVTFKELYVSSVYETEYALSKENKYSQENRIPLSVVMDFAREHNLQSIKQLPWGSPVFSYNGVNFCAYTEPSVGWEKKNSIARSWNIMANGDCFASLEDTNSMMSIPV